MLKIYAPQACQLEADAPAGFVGRGRGLFGFWRKALVLGLLWLKGAGDIGLAAPVALRVGPTGWQLISREGKELQLIVRGVRYRAYDEAGALMLETTEARLDGEGREIRFALTGPAAAEASLVARLTPLRRGFSLECRLRYVGSPRKWNPWTSGFQFDFALPITGVRTQPIVRWIKPTGARPWEVPGDTPYPDTEAQLRVVSFGSRALVMLCSEYDPDWIYGNNKERARFTRFVPPTKGSNERTLRMAFLLVPAEEWAPAAWAAEASGRPFALSIQTPRIGNLFTPEEPIRFEYRVRNVTEQMQKGTLIVAGWSYYGERLVAERHSLQLPPLAEWRWEKTLRSRARGVIFLAFRLKWEGGETIERRTIGILPIRRAQGTQPDSPFGLAAVIAAPERYPDQFDLPTVLALAERIGVRWIRGGWFSLQESFSLEDEARVRERIALLHRYGILPHVQLSVEPSHCESPTARERFQQRLRATLERFSWVSSSIEVGNELNYSMKARDYVETVLRPVHQVMREVFPGGKIMTMGFGGVQKEWLTEFVTAGGMELVDVLSIHPGFHPRAPEFWEGWRGWVFRSQLLDALKAARAHGAKELWITEVYAPTLPGRSGLDLRTAADYLVRTYVCALALGVKVIEWYQLQDGVWFAQRPCPEDVEYNFGLLYTDLSPKPAYVAYGVMTEQLIGAQYQGRLELGAEDLYGVRFIKGGQPLDVLWSYREKHETDLAWWPPEKFAHASRRPGEPWQERWQQPVAVTLPAAGPVAITDLMGNTRRLTPRDGKVVLRLTGSPIYVRGLGRLPWRPRFWEEID